MKRVVYLLVAAVVVMGFVACGDDGGEAPAVTDDGIVTSDELQDNSFAINGEVESFKSLALSNLGEYLCIVGSTHEGVGVFDDFFVGDNDYFYVAISPVLKGAEFDMMTESSLYTVISTLARAPLTEVTPATHDEITEGSCTFTYVDGEAIVFVDMVLSDGTMLAARMRVKDDLVVNENKIIRNGEVKPVRASFCKQEEGMTYLYFTPAGVDYYADMVESATWYIYLAVEDALCSGESIDLEACDGYFEAGLVDNSYAPLSIAITSDDLRGSTGTFLIRRGAAPDEFTVLMDVEWGLESMELMFSGKCGDATVVEERNNEIRFNGNAKSISRAIIDRSDSEIWSLQLMAKGADLVMYMPKERFDGTISGFSSDSRIYVSFNNEVMNKANGFTGTLIINFNEEDMTVEAEFMNNEVVGAYYVGSVEEV